MDEVPPARDEHPQLCYAIICWPERGQLPPAEPQLVGDDAGVAGVALAFAALVSRAGAAHR